MGFYSVFSFCEEPLVISGDEALAFRWHGNQLSTVAGKSDLSSSSSSSKPKMGTEFVFELRDPIDVPDVHDFGRFLCNRCVCVCVCVCACVHTRTWRVVGPLETCTLVIMANCVAISYARIATPAQCLWLCEEDGAGAQLFQSRQRQKKTRFGEGDVVGDCAT